MWTVDPPDPDSRDARLLSRHLAGDPDAFGELVRLHSDRAWAAAITMLRDREDAADAVQEAMLSAFRAAGSFRGEAKVSTWLHRIVVNACLDRIRRRAVRPTVPLSESTERDTPAPGDAMATREDHIVLAAALRALPDAQRVALVLVDVEGRPVAEVAALLAIPVGTVKSRCARARAQLAARLGYLRPGNESTLPSVSERERVVSPAVTSPSPQEVVGGEF
jgi:RNA polymerase sigma-70 factor (ECF subfamily)